ncbi:replication-associated protein G2P [Pseudomonas aeruginosa]|nr:replication-associated protein G2P [Pseudomonas aeruginosa]
MRVIDDEKVLAALTERHLKYDRKGKPNDSHARNLFRTYRSLKDYGWQETMESMARRTFYKHVNDICKAGLSKAALQKLHEADRANNVVPLLRFVQVDSAPSAPTGTSSRPWRPRDARADSRSPRAARRCRNPHSRPGRVGAQRWIRRPISTFVSTWSRTFPACSMTSTWCARSWTWSCAESSVNRPPRPFAGSASTEISRRSGAAGA